MAAQRMRFGTFIPPHVPPDIHPAICMDYNLDLVRLLDDLHYDEAWIGEHHSGGWEIVASPELFIAAAAQHTRTIRLGTGVSSVPYHNPYTLADRVRQLEYLSRGRAMFGVGPGSLPSDAYMQGVPTAEVRDILEERIGPLVRLLRGETVTASGKGFELQEARLQLPPYTPDGPETAVASQISPTGARMCGKFGLGMLSTGATSAGGFNALAKNWKIAEDTAAEHGQSVDRSRWRLVAPVHIAETRQKARENVRFGLERWVDYMGEAAALPLVPPGGTDAVEYLTELGLAVIGTPEDFVAQIERLRAQAGDFGAFLMMDHHWADFAETRRSYELVAKYAIPRINALNAARTESEAWLRNNHDRFRGEMNDAVKAKLEEYAATKGDDDLDPDVVALTGARTARAGVDEVPPA